MKKTIKKIICMILCFAMIFTTLQTTMFSASAKVVGPDNKTELTITTDKSKYSWGDTIVFNIDVKNVSNETLTGIRISSLARNYMKLLEDGDAPVISTLEPGETTTVQVKYYATKLVGAMAIFFPIIWLFSPAARIAYRETPFNYEKKVKVGAVKYRIGFEVEYGIEEKVTLTYDLSDIKVKGFPESQTVTKGMVPEEPDEPVSDDYIFAGWYKDTEMNSPYYFEDELEKDTTIIAKWIPLSESFGEIISENSSLYKSINERTRAFSSATSIYNVKVTYMLENGSGDIVISDSEDARILRTPGLIGKPVDITLLSDENVKTAKIAFEYDAEKLPSNVEEKNLGVLWFDEENNKLVQLEATVDVEKNTVMVQTNHFSKYLLVDTTAWETAWRHKQLVTRETGKSLRYNICMCLDTSGSMSGTAIKTCQESAKAFVDQLVEGDSIAVIGFNSSATTIVPQTQIQNEQSKKGIMNLINLYANGGTNFDKALYAAVEELSKMDDHSENYEIYKKYIVLISDGQSSVNAKTISQIVDCGYNVITIGIGNSVSEQVLKKLSQETSGEYAFVSDPKNIKAIFEQIQGQYMGLSKDSDGDGIADLVETSGMIDMDGYIYTTDPNSADTDGDGLSDSEEMGVYETSKGYFIVNSSPTTPTYKENRAKIENLHISPMVNNIGSLNIEDYLTTQFCITFDTVKREYPHGFVDGKEITDFLSEVLYENPRGITVTIKISDGTSKVFAYNEIKREKTEKIVFPITASKNSMIVDINVEITGDNIEKQEISLHYNFADAYLSCLEKVIEQNDLYFRQKATTAVQIVSKEENNANKEVDEIITLSRADWGTQTAQTKKLEVCLTEELSAIFKEKAREASKDLKNLEKSDSGEKLIKKIINLYDSDERSIKFYCDNIEYKAYISKNSMAGAGFGWIDVTSSNGQKYSYVFSSTMEQASAAMTDYMVACKAIENEAIKNCITETLKDSAKILKFDLAKELIEAKCGNIVDKYLIKNNYNFRYNDLKTAYNQCKNAYKAVENAKKTVEDPSINNLNKAGKAVEKLINYKY